MFTILCSLIINLVLAAWAILVVYAAKTFTIEQLCDLHNGLGWVGLLVAFVTVPAGSLHIIGCAAKWLWTMVSPVLRDLKGKKRK